MAARGIRDKHGSAAKDARRSQGREWRVSVPEFFNTRHPGAGRDPEQARRGALKRTGFRLSPE